MSVIYHEGDGDLSILDGRKIGVIGYGGMGRPVALNLRDSGLEVMLGVRAGGESEAQALRDGFRPQSISQIASSAEILFLLLPDQVMPQVYLEQITPHHHRSHTIIFASGYNIAFGFIEPPSFIDVAMLAPRTLGTTLRQRFQTGQGFYSFVGVGQDSSGKALQTVLALAKAVGSLRAGAIEITLEQEAELDLFMQQAILPVFHHMMTTAAKLLIKTGYPPEAAMLDLYISGELTDYLHHAIQHGMMHALQRLSLTGQYGIYSRLERFNELKLERLMEITLNEIRKTEFAQEWAREFEAGYPRLKKLARQQEQLELWDMEQQTIELLREIRDGG